MFFLADLPFTRAALTVGAALDCGLSVFALLFALGFRVLRGFYNKWKARQSERVVV